MRTTLFLSAALAAMTFIQQASAVELVPTELSQSDAILDLNKGLSPEDQAAIDEATANYGSISDRARTIELAMGGGNSTPAPRDAPEVIPYP